MAYQLFTGIAAADVNQYLSDNGFAVKGNKASVYVGQGLMLIGKRQVLPGRNGNYPLFYPAIAVIEFMTATILKKGDWLTLNSPIKNTKLTTQDVFYGRLGFYHDIFSSDAVNGMLTKLRSKLMPIDDSSGISFNLFQTNVSDYVPQIHFLDGNPNPDYLIRMDLDSIDTVLCISNKHLLSQFQSPEAVQSYLSWSKSVYGLNFNSVYFSHINELKKNSIPDIRTKYDVDNVDNYFFYMVKELLMNNV